MKINFRMWTFRVIFLLVGLTIAHLGVTLFCRRTWVLILLM